jgi:hypothetical protein
VHVSPRPTRTSPPWSRTSVGVSSVNCATWDTWKRASMPQWDRHIKVRFPGCPPRAWHH